MRYWLAAILLVAALPTALSARADDLPRAHFDVVGSFGASAGYKDLERPFWTERLAERSGGRITAEISSFDQIGIPARDLLQFTRLGAIEFATVALNQVSDDDPEAAGIVLSGLASDVDLVRRSLGSYQPTLSDLYRARYGLELIALWSAPAQMLFCNRPFSALADIAGFKVRVSGRIDADVVAGLGAVAVRMRLAATLDGFARREIDCAIMPAMLAYEIGLHTVATHIAATPIYWNPNMLVANGGFWRRLDPAVREFVSRQVDQFTVDVWRAAKSKTDEGIACVTGIGACSAGPPGSMSLVPSSDADRALLRRILTTELLPRWAQRCGDTCVSNWNDTAGRQNGLHTAAR